MLMMERVYYDDEDGACDDVDEVIGVLMVWLVVCGLMASEEMK
jgi:hypothetical protein